jgi:peptide/nickel transport system substrate-binding protein
VASRLGRIALVVSLAAIPALAACGTEEEAATEVAISYSAPLRLDPALAFGRAEGEALWLVHTPLLSYRRASEETGAELIPGLASDLPEVSDRGRTYTLTLREELEYSDGTPVAPRDFERAVERLLRLGGAGAERFDAVVGARRYAESRGAAGIAGIESDPDERSITIRLRSPDPAFANALAMTPAAPVPATTPLGEASTEPPPGVGPYEIAELVPGERFVLERSESFADLDIPDIPTGNVDRITASVVAGIDRQAQAVLDNRLDYMHAEPAAASMPAIREQAPERYVQEPQTATAYAFLNSRVAPFDDPLVREAVNRAIDRPALARLVGAQPGCAFLPPGVPGHDSSFDADDCPYGAPSERPDLDRARELIRQAGAEGTPVTVWGETGPGAAPARGYAEMLTAAGLFADPELVSPAEYRRVISAPDSRAQTGIVVVTAGVPNPLDLFRPLVGGGDASNPGHVHDPVLGSQVSRLSREAKPGERTDEWEEVDAYLVSPPQGYLAPVGHPTRGSLFSERIDVDEAIHHPAYGNDYSSWSLEEGE